jgi:hypothetical protein
MVILFVMLLVAFLPTGFFNWPSMISAANVQSPAACYFSLKLGQEYYDTACRKFHASFNDSCGYSESPALQSMVVSMVLLVFGLLARSTKILRPLSKTFHLIIRQPLSNLAKRVLKILRLGSLNSQRTESDPGPKFGGATRHDILFHLIELPALAIFLAIRIHFDLFSSNMAEVSRRGHDPKL